MKWTLDQLKAVYRGAYSFEEKEEGWLASFQYTKPQMDYFKVLREFFYDRCMASTAKTLEFFTESTCFSLDYRIIWEGSQDSFELAVDGLITDIRYVRDLEKCGRLTFSLPKGRKRITFYLPADATVLIREAETDKEIQPAEPGIPVLWLGDSITQGYGPLRSAETYVSVAQRELGWEVLNQGIGGYVYDPGSIMEMPGYHPQKIIVALGTNQYRNEDISPIRVFYRKLTEIYGSRIPILCITPIWRDGTAEEQARMVAFTEELLKIVSEYPQIHVVDGFRLVPHRNEYYLDGLHPNTLGCETYGRNLVKAIHEAGF